MPILFVLCDQWNKRRLELAAAGVKGEDVDMLDQLVTPATPTADAPATDPDTRRAQVEAFISGAQF